VLNGRAPGDGSRLTPASLWRPLIVTEVRMASASGQPQVVVGYVEGICDRRPIRQTDIIHVSEGSD